MCNLCSLCSIESRCFLGVRVAACVWPCVCVARARAPPARRPPRLTEYAFFVHRQLSYTCSPLMESCCRERKPPLSALAESICLCECVQQREGLVEGERYPPKSTLGSNICTSAQDIPRRCHFMSVISCTAPLPYQQQGPSCSWIASDAGEPLDERP